VAFSIPTDMLMTPTEYMAVDSQLPTSDSLSDGKLLRWSSPPASQAGSGEDEEGEEEGTSVQ